MRSRDVQKRMAAANPLDRERAAALPLSSAEAELLDALLAEPSPEPPSPAHPSALAKGRRPRRLAVGAVALASCLLAFLLTFGSDGGRPIGQPNSAYAAAMVDYAESAPRLLLTAPGWRVDGLVSGAESYMQFLRGNGPEPEQAELSWTPTSDRSLESRVRDLTDELDTRPLSTAPVLGTTATVIRYHEWSPEDLGLFALWEEDGYVVQYSARASTAAFEAQLASLQKVETETWLAAMPADVVRPEEFEPTVRQMLEGVAVPPGFTAADVVAASVPTDRYQLGASVAGSVSCAWFAKWAEARRRGDVSEVSAAVAAMATAKDWPVIRQMEREGAYGQILTHLAEAMPRGSVWRDRPLEVDVESALGCDRLGIPLSR
ncbi:MAG TPA: hypothetical protein VD761_05985 [Solirubrobacterales bacterium]|nr:hypothetical protein [Solirubrobacterales bacterium]